jgi:hypothetical protein
MDTFTNKTKTFFVFILMAICSIGLTWAEEKTPPPPDPYADTQILVEAFIVKANTASLKEIGVDLLGQGPDGISILKLAACLQKETAQVVSGAKVTAKQARQGKTRDDKRIYLKQINKSIVAPKQGDPAGKPIESVSIQYRDYDFGKTLEVFAKILSETAILTEYKYLENGILTDPKNYDPNNAPPPDTYKYSWEGSLSLCPGKPVIAGASQNKDSVIFLVLTATAQNMPEAKP